MKSLKLNKTLITGFTMVILMWVCGSSELEGQTLSFNKILKVSSQDTVPQGKVWKVTSVMSSDNMYISVGTTSSQSNYVTISVDGATIYIKGSWGSSYGTSAMTITDMPIWLSAGSTLAASTGAAAVSVIEFNLTP